MKKLKSLSIFFPFYNDAGTVGQAISNAYLHGERVADNLEVIAIHGGDSSDNTWQEIMKQKKKYPQLVVIDKSTNQEGYAVIKYGFKQATKDWAFYTDGDLQYYLTDLEKLVNNQAETNADVVNGYKIKREDNLVRVIFGGGYRVITKTVFRLPIRDLDCDFRLIRKKYLDQIKFESKDSSITLELVKKLQYLGARFTEVPVKHRKRIYGKSTYKLSALLNEKIIGDFKTWLRLKKYAKTNV